MLGSINTFFQTISFVVS